MHELVKKNHIAQYTNDIGQNCLNVPKTILPYKRNASYNSKIICSCNIDKQTIDEKQAQMLLRLHCTQMFVNLHEIKNCISKHHAGDRQTSGCVVNSSQ